MVASFNCSIACCPILLRFTYHLVLAHKICLTRMLCE
nr:MAG TPA: hypothetical protein [Bacteriophage sp.]